MKYLVRIAERELEIEILEKANRLTVRLNGKEYPARILESASPHYSILLGNRVIELESEQVNSTQRLVWNGEKFEAQVEDKRLAEIEKSSPVTRTLVRELKSPLPGVVVKVEVQEEEEVKAGQGILILEAMKMENEIKSSFPGKIKKILVREKQTVEKDQPLIIFD